MKLIKQILKGLQDSIAATLKFIATQTVNADTMALPDEEEHGTNPITRSNRINDQYNPM